MIDITPEILGPGIEEEYADAMERILFLLDAFKAHSPSNDTAHGRVIYQLLWLKGQIEARRLPIPVDRSWVSTLHYVVGSCEVDDTPAIAFALGELSIIVKGIGLIKPRHIPVLIASIEDLIADIHRHGDPLLANEITLVTLLKETATGLKTGTIQPPVETVSRPNPITAAMVCQERLESLFPPDPSPLSFLARRRPIAAPIYEAFRPPAARKPPLAAPVLGLSPTAPDFTAVRDLIKTQITPETREV